MTDTTQPPAETLADVMAQAALIISNTPVSTMVGRCGWKKYSEAEEGMRAILAALTRPAGGDAIPAGEQYRSGYAQGQADAEQLNRWMQDKAWQDTVLMLVHYKMLAERTWLVGHEVAAAKLAEWWGHARALSDTKSVEDIAATPKPPAGGDAGEGLVERVCKLLRDEQDRLDVESGDYLMDTSDCINVIREKAAALALPAPVVEGEIVPPENGEPDPEWRAIKRAIDQFVGRVPTISKHRALNNAHIKGVVDRLDASGDHEAADTIVWQCWWRALDRERERFLLADKDEQIAALSDGRSHG